MLSEELKNNLNTEFSIPENIVLSANSHMFFAGSCFSENIGERLQKLGMNCLINPHGIIYDPLSIQRSLERIVSLKPYTENHLYFSNGTFHSLDHHGSFNHPEAGKLVERINSTCLIASDYIKNSNLAIITLGTAWVYYHTVSESFVANCHKIPQREFSKSLLSETAIASSLNLIVSYLKKLNPGIKVIFTVSPVKHLRDGILENAISKARLQSAVWQVIHQLSSDDVTYFPAYEIMTEELRDYRFYKHDLAHPSEWSVQYIFRRFIETCADNRCKDYLNRAEKFSEMQRHRIMSDNPEVQNNWTAKKQEFLKQLLKDFPESGLTIGQ